MFLLVDADSLLWKAALGTNSTGWNGEPVAPSVEDAYQSFIARLCNIQLLSGLREYVLCMSSGESFRKKAVPSYKSHRPLPPIIIGLLKHMILERHEVLLWPGLEGDDVVGIHSDIPGAVIYSEDKDLLQLPGQHWDWESHSIIQRDHLTCLRFFYTQVLTGDTADGYKGCPDIGPTKAQFLLDGIREEDMWDMVCLTYQLHGCTDEHAIQQAHLAWLLRTGPNGLMRFIPPERKTILCQRNS